MIRLRLVGHQLRSLVAFGVGLAGAGPAQAASAPQAWILDPGWNSVVALEPATGRRLATLMAKSRPEGLLISPDGSRLAMLERGPGEDKGERGFKARGKSAVTLIDTAARAILARVELGNGVATNRAYFGSDRVAFLCPGYEAKNPGERQIRELVVLDLKDGREAGRLALEDGVFPVEVARDGRTLVLVQGLPRSTRYPYPQSRVWFVDLSGPSIEGRADASGWSDLYSDGDWLYLLDRGLADPDTRKNRNGSVQVVSLERRAVVASLDAGRAPRGLFGDAGSPGVVIASDGAPGRLDGELRVIRGESMAVAQGIAASPKLVVARRDRVFVVGASAVTVADRITAHVGATIPLVKGNERLVFDDDVPRELELSPDGRQAFLLYEPGSKLAVLDLDPARLVGVTRTGRGSQKLMRGIGAVAGAVTILLPAPVSDWASVAQLAAVSMAASAQARPSRGLLAVRGDGQRAYALGITTQDLTAVNTATAEALAKIGVPGFQVRAMGGGSTLAVTGLDRLVVLDTATLRVLLQMDLKGAREVVVARDGRHALALAAGAVVCLDGATGSVVATMKNVVDPTQVVFDGAWPVE